MVDLVKNNLDDIIAICKSHSVKSLSIFGSASKDTMHKDSDIDFLVEFSSDIEVLDYADNYFSLLDGLLNILNTKIDLVSVKSIKNPVLKKEIYRSKVDLYAA